MPMIRIELSPGRTDEQKRKYAEEVTKLTSEILKCPIESVDMIFIEVPGSHWANGGKFMSLPAKK
jgi:4-oxalocrotonate tautomerase